MVNTLLLDLSGVLYEGDVALPGAADAVRQAQHSGLTLRFITNTSQKARIDLLQQLHALGFSVADRQLFTAVDAAIQWLQQRSLSPFCLVHDNIADQFADLQRGPAEAVLIADAAEGFTYPALNRAFQLCMAGTPLLAVGYNRYYRSQGELRLDAGAFVKAIEFAAGIKATIVGKPSADFFMQALAGTPAAADPEQAMMVGDDVFGDIEGAIAAGIGACLVRTGKYRPGDEDRVTGNFSVLPSITEVVKSVLAGNRFE